ncbi:MAG: PrsW family glutamic-type intramembrane protease [Candidatus Peribacteraceae bacterium]|jgi:hypothetical protein
MHLLEFLRRAGSIAEAVWGTVSPVFTTSLDGSNAGSGISALTLVGIFVGFLILSGFLTRVWIGIVNVSFIDVESLASIEKRQPYLPSLRTIIFGLVGTVLLVMVSLRTLGAIAPFAGPEGKVRAMLVLGGMAVVLGIVLFVLKEGKEYVFAVISGTLVSFILIAFTRALLETGDAPQDPFIITLSVIAIALVWKFLFGPWDANVKATVLGTFLFWIAFHTLFQETADERLAHGLAIGIAAIPAGIWCALFLRYHRERLSVVFLMFFSGMVSTAPILFYDALVKREMELQFFVFRVIPESFNVAVHSAIAAASEAPPLQAMLLSLFLTFIFVGVLEEGSKYWVLRRNGQMFFSSIDDAMQLAIMVAVGFAFAENITTTGYFYTFVKEFLQQAGQPDWAGFMGNIAGRSILTSMVHIVSTGLLGYFFGVALFLDPSLKAAHQTGRKFWTGDGSHYLVGIQKQFHFRSEMIATGFALAVVLHAVSNFLVTLPDVLPGNPRTFGDLLHSPPGSPLHYVALLLLPSLFYVVGGFWLLTTLFLSKQNMQERGHVISTEMFVMED